MADLSDFKTGQIVVTCMVGASVTKTAQMFGVLRGSVLKVKIASEKDKKNIICKAQVWLKVKVI